MINIDQYPEGQRLVAAIRDVVRASPITAETKFRDADAEQSFYDDVNRMAVACVVTSFGDDGHYHRAVIRELIAACGEYGCWIDSIEEGVEEADYSFMPEPETARERMKGALYMAKMFLFELTWAQGGGKA